MERVKEVYHAWPPPTTRGGNQEAGGGPHATAPVLKYKATGEKRTIPQKHSTNLGVEAKGQRAPTSVWRQKDSGQHHFPLKGAG